MTKKITKEVEALAGALHSSAIHLLRRLRREDDRSGLNAPRLSALSVIVFAGPISLGDLARAEQVRPPTMSRIVRALETRNLVIRDDDENDARAITLSATPVGKRLLLAGRTRRVHLLARKLATLSPTDREALQRAVSLLEDILPTL